MLFALILAAAHATQAAPAKSVPAPSSGTQTVISYASGGGLRDWRRSGEPGVLFVRDRTERWYKVTLDGPCRFDRPLDTLVYTTDVNGTFDRFSRVRLLRYPETNCGVAGIVRSGPPPSQKSRKD